MIWLILRWSARITGLSLVGLVMLFVMGEGGLPNMLHQPPCVQIEFLAVGLMLAGFLVGWRWEGVGGILSVLGFALFFVTEISANGRPPGGLLPLFAVPGILFLLSHSRRCFPPSKGSQAQGRSVL